MPIIISDKEKTYRERTNFQKESSRTLTSICIHANLRINFQGSIEEDLIKEKKKEETPGLQKLVYRLEEISRIAKVSSRTIESWEKEFYFVHAGVTASGERIFRKKDLEIILEIKRLLYEEKMTIEGARQKLKRQATEIDPPDRRFFEDLKAELQDILKTLSS